MNDEIRHNPLVSPTGNFNEDLFKHLSQTRAEQASSKGLEKHSDVIEAEDFELKKYSTQQIEELEAKMLPGKLSDSGFLAPGESLAKVISDDNETLKRLGITHQQIADRLQGIIGKANNPENRGSMEVDINGEFTVRLVAFAGYQECPFGDRPQNDDPLGNMTVLITNKRTGQQLGLGSLLIHLIRDHHFFEGHTGHRLDPEQAIDILEIKKGNDYTPSIRKEKYYILKTGMSEWKGEVKIIKKYQDIINNPQAIHEQPLDGVDVYYLDPSELVVLFDLSKERFDEIKEARELYIHGAEVEPCCSKGYAVYSKKEHSIYQ